MYHNPRVRPNRPDAVLFGTVNTYHNPASEPEYSNTSTLVPGTNPESIVIQILVVRTTSTSTYGAYRTPTVDLGSGTKKQYCPG